MVSKSFHNITQMQKEIFDTDSYRVWDLSMLLRDSDNKDKLAFCITQLLENLCLTPDLG